MPHMMAVYYGHLGSDDMVVDAARVSFAKRADQYAPERNVRLLRYLVAHRHLLPFRHPHVAFRMAAPIFVARQLGKHQVGMEWSEISRRYVSGEPLIYAPVVWHGKPEESIKQGAGDVHPQSGIIFSMYNEAMRVAEKLYRTMIYIGVAPEEARMVLPQSMVTEWLWTGSLLAWAHVFNERTAPGAQAATREIVGMIDEKMGELFPVSWPLLTAVRHEAA